MHCYGHSLRDVPLSGAAGGAYAAGMVLRLEDKGFLRLRGARGVAIEVVEGRVWITEDGRRADTFLARGARYQVRGDGLVLVSAEARASAVSVRRG